MASDIHDEFTSKPGVLQGWADRVGGVTGDHTGGATVGDIQHAFGKIAGLAAGKGYNPAPPAPPSPTENSPKYEHPTPDPLANFTTLPPDHLTRIRDRMSRMVQDDMKDSSDYDEDQNADESEGSGAEGSD
ncbi:hypothetical protein FRC11_005230 [Ceratobasidium sp. 423]|nr:hypothetical protein FRC11_005230 [Ceratobasidium sp. 423]